MAAVTVPASIDAFDTKLADFIKSVNGEEDVQTANALMSVLSSQHIRTTRRLAHALVRCGLVVMMFACFAIVTMATGSKFLQGILQDAEAYSMRR